MTNPNKFVVTYRYQTKDVTNDYHVYDLSTANAIELSKSEFDRYRPLLVEAQKPEWADKFRDNIEDSFKSYILLNIDDSEELLDSFISRFLPNYNDNLYTIFYNVCYYDSYGNEYTVDLID